MAAANQLLDSLRQDLARVQGGVFREGATVVYLFLAGAALVPTLVWVLAVCSWRAWLKYCKEGQP